MLSFTNKKGPSEKKLVKYYWIQVQNIQDEHNSEKWLKFKRFKKYSDIRKEMERPHRGYYFKKNGTYSDLRPCGTGYHIENHTWNLGNDTLSIFYKDEMKKQFQIKGLNEKWLYLKPLK